MAGLDPAIHVFAKRKTNTACRTRPADQVRGLRSLRSLGLLHERSHQGRKVFGFCFLECALDFRFSPTWWYLRGA